ncbi:hypothetical protein JCM19235_1933 [Vibrio maritimus]|uniref:Uncharacterized protein n=1 Tax=Vibrio maritimus TaxID=990268 RepID=A0A090RSZ8_9VIBR|nr:hypothetical protein JCM19235_1933 [Vibrio maritimus]
MEMSRLDDIMETVYGEGWFSRVRCPSGDGANKIGVKLREKIEEFPAGGVIFFEIDAKPINGQLVLVFNDGIYEIMKYIKVAQRSLSPAQWQGFQSSNLW